MSPSSITRIGLTACVLLACSSETPRNPTLPSNDAASTTQPGFDGGVISPSGHAVITINSPVDGALLTVNSPVRVSARIVVEEGDDFVDPATVRARVSMKNSAVTLASAMLNGPFGSSEYHGDVDISNLRTGQYLLTVSAATSGGVPTDAQVAFSIDSGPQIIVISPLAGRHYKGGVIVQVFADAGAFGDVTDLQANVGGIMLNLQPAGPPNQYRAEVAFDSVTPPLAGTQLVVVSAKNSVNGTKTEIRFTFVIDDQGPAITATTPAPEEIVNGLFKISAKITDDAGLNESSIQAIVGDRLTDQFKLPLRLDADGRWSVLFDSHVFPSCKIDCSTPCAIFPTLSFRAADELGNESVVSYEFSLDSLPPIADLTPPPVRDRKRDMGMRCSFPFDPLSNNRRAGDMPDDGCMVPQVFDLRARIEDQGNYCPRDVKLVPVSLVDPDRTAVYVLDDPSRPLVVDSDGDGFCDAVNPQLVPTTTPVADPRQVLKIRMAPVPAGGHADFRTDVTVSSLFPPAVCEPGKDLDPPEILCIESEPTIAISYTVGGEPAIWSLEPINEGRCFGLQFDALANNIGENGWKCIAVVASDKNGNTSTSEPIRVWVDYDYGGQLNTHCRPPPGNAGPPPNCTGTVDGTGTVTSTPCRSLNFGRMIGAGEVELCLEGNCG